MKFKRVIAILLCVAMTLSLVACGGNHNKPNNNGNKSSYTVTFDVGEDARADGVSNPESVTVKAGEGIELPSPVWADHQLINWMNGTAIFTSSNAVNSDITLVAQWIKITQYDRDINDGKKDWVQSGHLYIHYKRGDHVESEEGTVNDKAKAPDYSGDNDARDNFSIDSKAYGEWGAWVWPKSNSNGKEFNAAFIDESGAVYDILLNNEYDNAGWDGTAKKAQDVTINFKDESQVGFQIHKIITRTQGEGFWVNDSGDNFITLADCKRDNGSYHWYVSENEVNKGTAYYTAPEIDNPYKEDNKEKTKFKSTIDIDSTKDNKSQFPKYKDVAVDMEDTAVGYQIFIASFCDSNNDGIGDIPGIISRLDYLESLNVDILWLTPFQTSTGYHGYDISDYYSVDSKFGTLADYRQLVYQAHKRGMKVVMDFVLNHTALSNEWFIKSSNLVKERDPETGKMIDYRNFYNWISKADYDLLSKEEKTQWYEDKNGYYVFSSFNSSQPELNFDYQPVRNAIVNVAKYWMEFGLDGFRLDAVKHIYMKNEITGDRTSNSQRKWSGTNTSSKYYGQWSNNQYSYLGDDGSYSQDIERNLNFYHEFNHRIKSAYPNAYIVGENLTGSPAALGAYYDGIDSQFNFNLYYDVSRAVAKAGSGSNQIKIDNALQAWEQNHDGTGTWPALQQSGLSFSRVNSNYIDSPFTSNHDLPRARDRLNITGTTPNDDAYTDTFFTDTTEYKFVDADEDDPPITCKSVDGKNVNTANVTKTDVLLRLYYAFQMTVPGVSWIYYGDEIGMTGLMQYSVASQTSTSSTASQPHEDVVYRQPMKWNKQESKGTEDNASFLIGYGDIMCQLEGLNATKYVPSVAEQDIDESNTTTPTTLLNWMRLLTKIRNDYRLGQSTLKRDINSWSANTTAYTVTSKADSSKKIKVQLWAAENSKRNNVSGSLAYYSGQIDGKYYTVLITKA